ncbi:hypothetical protein ACN38_g13225, partial [Penicillium nordicum]
SKMTKPAISTI